MAGCESDVAYPYVVGYDDAFNFGEDGKGIIAHADFRGIVADTHPEYGPAEIDERLSKAGIKRHIEPHARAGSKGARGRKVSREGRRRAHVPWRVHFLRGSSWFAFGLGTNLKRAKFKRLQRELLHQIR